MKNIYFIKLKDIYGDLLTDKQLDILTQYYDNDLTLSEISLNLDISRQAVHFTIKQAEELLNNYDEKLNLVEKFDKIEALTKDLEINKIVIDILRS